MEREDVLFTLQRDLEKALQKPPEKRRWGMLIDTRKCIGCHACTIGCVAEYKLPPGVVYRPVIDKESGTFPNVKRSFLPRPCFQCEKPSCVPVCPVNATKKRSRRHCFDRLCQMHRLPFLYRQLSLWRQNV